MNRTYFAITVGLLVTSVVSAQELDKAVFTPAEQEVRQNILSKPTDIEFVETPLIDVIAFLKEQAGTNIILDAHSLDVLQVDVDTPITLSVQKVPLRKTLQLFLQPLELTYSLEGNVIVVRAIDRLPDQLRLYPIADLIKVEGETGSELLLAEDLKRTIASSTGAEKISYHFPSQSLVISDDYQSHEQIVQLLNQLLKIQSSAPPRSAEATLSYLNDLSMGEMILLQKQLTELQAKVKELQESQK